MKKILSCCLIFLLFVSVAQAEEFKSIDVVDSGKEIRVEDPKLDVSDDFNESGMKLVDDYLDESEGPIVEENKEVLEDLDYKSKLEEGDVATKSLSDSYEPFLDYAIDPMGAQKSLGVYETDLSTGAGTYNYSLITPPGRNGVQPQITFSYNNQSSSADSVVGYGWDLWLGGSISRTKDYGVEDIYSTNEFYLNMAGASGKLIPISLIDSEHGEYGLQVEESFYKYEFLVDNSWVITDQSGVKYYFGQTTDSRQDDPNDLTRIFEWELDVIQDTSDNYVRFEYFKDQGQIYPKAIYYTGHGNPSMMNDGPMEVRFQPFFDGVQVGDERDDWTKWYDKGFEVKTEYLVESVEVFVNAQVVKNYDLTYTTGENGRRSMLESITEIGTSIEGDIVQLPSTEFTYSMSDGFYDFDYEGVYADLSESSHFVDINGDGYADQAPFDENAQGYHYFYMKLSVDGGIGYGGEYFKADYSNSGAPVSPADSGYYVDMNGDALPEYIAMFDSPSIDCTYRNYGQGFVSGLWTNACAEDFDDRQVSGFRFGDLNGDGLMDLFTGDTISSDWTVAGDNIYLNDGDLGFVDSGFDSPVVFAWGSDQYPSFYEGQDSGVRLVDLNGDGLVDMVHAYRDLHYDNDSYDDDPMVLNFYLNTGDGNFVQDFDYDLSFTSDLEFANIEYGDYYNPTSSYHSYSNDICYADFNGDGVVDVIKDGEPYIWDGVDSWTYANYDYYTVDLSCGGYTYAVNGTSSFNSAGDLNGDGLMDFYDSLELINNGVRGTYFNIEGKPDLLTDISTSLGADISISYRSALQYEDDLGDFLNPDLPFAIYTVEEVIVDDGLGNQSSTSYEYSGGHYFKYFDGIKGEFSRFEEVSVFEDGATTIYYFDTGCYEGELCAADGLEDEMIILTDVSNYVVDGDYLRELTGGIIGNELCINVNCENGFETYHDALDGILPIGEEWDDPNGDTFIYSTSVVDHALKGKMSMVEVYDDLGNLYSRTVNNWSVDDLGDGRYYPHMDEFISFSFDGEVDARETSVSYTYNPTYGLLMTETQWGEVEADEATYEILDEMLDDEIYISYSYSSDESLWVFKEAEVLLEDGDGTTLKDTRYYYDDYVGLGDVDEGLLTEESVWWDDAAEWVSTLYDYDAYGNLISTINPKGYETVVTYDAQNFYPETVTNPLQQSVSIVMNYINGEPAEYTDYNGYTYFYTYDGLGRSLLVEGPSVDGTGTVIHASYDYDDLSVPRFVHEAVSDGTLDDFNTYTYLDGLDREIQIRVEGETEYSVVDTLYNSRGEVDLNTLAYFNAGNSYASVDLSQPTMEYSYDALLRVVDVETPLGSTVTDYSHWEQTVTDALNNVKDYYYDAYGNLVQVDEIELYSTYYDYDLLGNLIYIEDAMGNIREFEYNSLGLMTMQEEMHDPADVDYATWEYYYDYNGNLHTVNVPGHRITYSYDHLDRLLIERTDLVPIIAIYTYDTAPNGIGLLSTVEDLAGEVSYEYDAIGGLTSETRVFERDDWTTEYSNDLMGRLESVTYPSDMVASYTFNEGGFVDSVTYDGEIVVSDLNYSPMGQWEEIYYGNGDVTTNVYDPQQMYFLDNKVTTSATGTVLQNLSYEYDVVGDVMIITDESEVDTAKKVFYEYDDLYRLTRAVAVDLTYADDIFTDDDGDGIIIYDGDNCLDDYNPNQEDWNMDGIGDVCQDSDGDGLLDSFELNDLGSDPGLVDTDDDSFSDYEEYDAGTDLNDVGSMPPISVNIMGEGYLDFPDGCPCYYYFDDMAEMEYMLQVNYDFELYGGADFLAFNFDKTKYEISELHYNTGAYPGWYEVPEDAIVDDEANLDPYYLGGRTFEEWVWYDVESFTGESFLFFHVTLDHVDTDGDSVYDYHDNCPDDANVDQLDTDGDDIGDVCDPDPLVPEDDGGGPAPQQGAVYYERSYDYSPIGNMTYKSDVGTLYYDETGNANPYAVTSAGAYVFDYDVAGNVSSDGVFDYYYNHRNEMLWSDDGNGNYLDYIYDYDGGRVVKDDTNYNISYYPNQYYEEERFDSEDPIFRDYVFVDGVRVMVNEVSGEEPVDNLPDLEVTQICIDNNRLTVEMANTGTMDVTDNYGRTYIYLDGALRWTYSWRWLFDKSFLLAGGSSWLQPRVIYQPYPEVEACIDASNRIVESDENNNCLLVTQLGACVE